VGSIAMVHLGARADSHFTKGRYFIWY
jgi:hypothetical protein